MAKCNISRYAQDMIRRGGEDVIKRKGKKSLMRYDSIRVESSTKKTPMRIVFLLGDREIFWFDGPTYKEWRRGDTLTVTGLKGRHRVDAVFP